MRAKGVATKMESSLVVSLTRAGETALKLSIEPF